MFFCKFIGLSLFHQQYHKQFEVVVGVVYGRSLDYLQMIQKIWYPN